MEKKSYSAPDVTAEDRMEQTALLTCWVTEGYEGVEGTNFVADECARNVEKAPGFDGLVGCLELWTGGDNKSAEPFS